MNTQNASKLFESLSAPVRLQIFQCLNTLRELLKSMNIPARALIRTNVPVYKELRLANLNGHNNELIEAMLNIPF